MANNCLDDLISTPGGIVGGLSLWAIYCYLLVNKALPALENNIGDDDYAEVNGPLIIAILALFGGAVPICTGAMIGRLLEFCVAPCLKELVIKVNGFYNQPLAGVRFFPVDRAANNNERYMDPELEIPAANSF